VTCKQCGTPNPDNSATCCACGSPLSTNGSVQQKSQQIVEYEKEKSKDKVYSFLGCICCGIILLMFVTCVFG